MQKIVEYKEINAVVYTKRKQSKSIKISVGSRGVKVSLPYGVSFTEAEKFVELNIEKIRVALERQKHRENLYRDKLSLSEIELKQIRMEAHRILPEKLQFWSAKLNATVIIKNMFGVKKSNPFAYNRLSIKNNRSNWGSCSARRNINLNMHLVNLPNHLVDFVIIHELCHLIYPNHGDKFHKLVDEICGGKEAQFSKELRGYKL